MTDISRRGFMTGVAVTALVGVPPPSDPFVGYLARIQREYSEDEWVATVSTSIGDSVRLVRWGSSGFSRADFERFKRMQEIYSAAKGYTFDIVTGSDHA